MINLLQIRKERHFIKEADGATYLNREGKRIFIVEFDEKLNDKIKVKEKNYTYRQLIEEEIRKFERYLLKGETYKPYKYW